MSRIRFAEMFYHLVRDSFFGRMVYHASNHRLMTHPEEQPGYVVPDKYLKGCSGTSSGGSTPTAAGLDKTFEPDDLIFVEWEGEADPENPRNWPLWQRIFFNFEISALTLAIYMGAPIYTPGEAGVMADLGVGQTGALAALSAYVWGYGTGPMLLSPLSEHPHFGRTSIYIITLGLFIILQIPTALVDNLAGFVVLRYLGGFFASPALATGGASLGDITHKAYMPPAMGAWGLGAICGPFFGPLIGAALVVAKSWRWTFWYLAMQAGLVFIILFFLLPETSEATLLKRKAERLRRITGNQRIVAKEAYEASQKTPRQLAIEILWRPIEVSVLEPMALAINLHLALLYAILYLWFESFPIVLQGIHGFTLVEMGVAYMAMLVGSWIGLAAFLPYVHKRFSLPVLRGEPVDPEVFLPFNLIGSILLPIGLFVFGWTATASIHWIAPIMGTFIFAPGAFLLFNTHLNYLSYAFPDYLASVFAGNDLFRSCVGAAFPLFAHSLYANTASEKFPVGWGCSIMAFIATGMIAIPILFMWKGKKLRAMSKRSS